MTNIRYVTSSEKIKVKLKMTSMNLIYVIRFKSFSLKNPFTRPAKRYETGKLNALHFISFYFLSKHLIISQRMTKEHGKKKQRLV